MDAEHHDGWEDWSAPDEDLPEMEFADPGGESSLYAATAENPRIYPCPDCGEPNRLTKKDVWAHHCCDACADRVGDEY